MPSHSILCAFVPPSHSNVLCNLNGLKVFLLHLKLNLIWSKNKLAKLSAQIFSINEIIHTRWSVALTTKLWWAYESLEYWFFKSTSVTETNNADILGAVVYLADIPYLCVFSINF